MGGTQKRLTLRLADTAPLVSAMQLSHHRGIRCSRIHWQEEFRHGFAPIQKPSRSTEVHARKYVRWHHQPLRVPVVAAFSKLTSRGMRSLGATSASLAKKYSRLGFPSSFLIASRECKTPPNDRTERRRRPGASALPTGVARPRSLQ